MPTERKVILQYRPETKTTRSSREAEAFDRQDADPLGFRRVFTQVAHDLYGTKDVQDAITASYVWMADQIGHLTLGLVPTLLLGAIWHAIWTGGTEPYGKPGDLGDIVGFMAVALVVFAYWIYKEWRDYVDTERRAVKRFAFDAYDILWNIQTALLYFGIGGLLALSALIDLRLVGLCLALAIWPALRVAFWWLRRKLAYQQAGLPYLYRLTNFSGIIDDHEVAAATDVANMENRPIGFWQVLFRRDVVELNKPDVRHLLIAGPLRSGKTSLAVGIGTEFAFALGYGRYLSAAKLMQLVAGPQDPLKTVESEMEYNDGRLLWPMKECDLIIVDDVDNGIPTSAPPIVSAVRPQEFEAALKTRNEQPLAWLGKKRSVWVLGNTSMVVEWKTTIADLLNVAENEIMTIALTPAPPPAPPVLSYARRRGVGYAAGALGLILLGLSALWWDGEARWGRFEALAPERAFADGTFGLELAPLKFMLVASDVSGRALEMPGGRPWPERFGFIPRPNAGDSRCEGNAPANLPVGFTVSQRLPGNATPVPVKFVGLSCAACHATEIATGAGPIIGAGTQTADVIAFTDAFLSAVLDDGVRADGGLSGARILAAYDKQCPGEAAGPLGWIDRRIEVFLIDQWLSGARAQARINVSKYDLPYHGAQLGDPGDIPAGPSRTRPFRSVVRNTLDLPGATNRAFSKVPLAAMQADKPWSQFDGSIGDPVVRSMVAVFTSGASTAGLAEPQIVDNIRKAAAYTLKLGVQPPLPALAATFLDRAKPSDDVLTRGSAVYLQQCDSCHGHPEAAGWKMPPSKGRGPDIVTVGTDPARIDFRYSAMLPTAIAAYLPMRDITNQQAEIDKQVKAALQEGAFAEADWWRRASAALVERSRQFPAGHPLAFPAAEIAKRDGFLKAPIPFVWLRAPYLHNASVPTLRALIGLDARPTVYCRGTTPDYDAVAIGLRVVLPENGKCPPRTPFLFDTAAPGNSAAGHVFPPPGKVGRDDLEALLAYLGTL